MKKRHNMANKGRLASNNRRRHLLKRMQQKISSRRQQFHILETREE
jgi:hypothetical protein